MSSYCLTYSIIGDPLQRKKRGVMLSRKEYTSILGQIVIIYNGTYDNYYCKMTIRPKGNISPISISIHSVYNFLFNVTMIFLKMPQLIFKSWRDCSRIKQGLFQYLFNLTLFKQSKEGSLSSVVFLSSSILEVLSCQSKMPNHTFFFIRNRNTITPGMTRVTVTRCLKP